MGGIPNRGAEVAEGAAAAAGSSSLARVLLAMDPHLQRLQNEVSQQRLTKVLTRNKKFIWVCYTANPMLLENGDYY